RPWGPHRRRDRGGPGMDRGGGVFLSPHPADPLRGARPVSEGKGVDGSSWAGGSPRARVGAEEDRTEPGGDAVRPGRTGGRGGGRPHRAVAGRAPAGRGTARAAGDRVLRRG